MQSLGRVLALDGDRSPYGDFWYERPGTNTPAGVRITPETVMGIPAVYACITAISEDIAKVPLPIYEDLGERGSRKTTNHPIGDLLMHQPNDWQTAIEFREMMTAFTKLRKFAIAEQIPGRRGPVDQLIPLHPDLVREEVSTSGLRRYIYRDPKLNGRERTLLADEVFVLRGKQSRSVLDFAANSLALELAYDRYEGFLFSRGVKSQGAVSSPKLLPDPVRKGIRRALDEYAIGGPRAGRPLLLEDGMTWTNISLTNTDAQYDQIRKASLRQVCRWFRMPPHKIADLEDAHFTNIETQSIEYIVDVLLSEAIRWEQAIRRDLIIAKDRFYARHNLDALLRGESEARSRAYALAIMWGWLTRNEVRELENRNPLDGLSEPLTPLNEAKGSMLPDGGAKLLEAGPLTVRERGTLKLMASGVAERLVRREYAAITKLAARSTTQQAFRDGVEQFYGEHVDEVARDLAIPRHVAAGYVRQQRGALLDAGPTVMETWLEDRVAHLTDLAMDKPEALAA